MTVHEMSVRSPMPEDFRKCLKEIERGD